MQCQLALKRRESGSPKSSTIRTVARALTIPPPGFEQLTIEEQIDYVQTLWNAIAAKPEQVEVPDWHRKVLDERLAGYEQDPDEGTSWEDFQAELQTDHVPEQ